MKPAESRTLLSSAPAEWAARSIISDSNSVIAGAKPNNPLRRGENNHDLALELRFTGCRFLSVAVSRSYSRLCEVGLTFLTLCPADRSFPSNIVNKIKLNLLPTLHHSPPPPPPPPPSSTTHLSNKIQNPQ